jgi:alpha-glucosidase (family GH31 glycosyl hydrolase)
MLKDGYNDEKLEIYNVDGVIWKSFKYNDDFSDNEIQPYALKPENILLVFSCIGKTETFYKIIINEKKKNIKYIKKSDAFFKYETWEQHLLEIFSVDFNINENPIKSKPMENAKEIVFDTNQFYHPVKVNGDWLMIIDDNEKEGWVKWKDSKGKMILTLYYD